MFEDVQGHYKPFAFQRRATRLCHTLGASAEARAHLLSMTCPPFFVLLICPSDDQDM